MKLIEQEGHSMKRIPYLFVTIFFLVTACVPGWLPISQPVTQTSSNQPQNSRWPSEAEFQKRMRDKPAYNGPVKVKIDTALLESNLAGQQVDLTEALNQPPAFRVQFDQEYAVWQQTLHIPDGTKTWQFETPDLTSRYTLQVQKHGSGQANLSLNLNGTNWLSGENQLHNEQSFPHLLLSPSNSLRATLTGDPGVSVTLSLRSGGTLPYLINQRQGALIHPEDTQASRLQRNDVNYFNPALANSLNNLRPYQGHLSADSAVSPGITGISVDGGGTLLFETGTLILQLNNPEQAIPELQQRYGAELKHVIDIPEFPQLTTHYLAFDLDTSPIHETTALIRAYREHIPALFEDFVFASEDGLRTFVILLDILVRHPDWVRNWDLNLYGPDPSVNLPTEPALDLDPVTANDWDSPATHSPSSANNRGWWLRDTFAREAWSLSQGTGTTVAYLDRGYENLFNGSNVHPEFERERFIVDSILQNIPPLLYPGDVNTVSNNPLDCIDRILPGESVARTSWCGRRDHGFHTLMSSFAQRNNGRGTAGIAPNVRIIPYNTGGTIMTYAIALSDVFMRVIGEEKIDVIGFNHNFYVAWGWKTNSDASLLFQPIDILTTMFQIPIVVSAHNDAFWWPNNDPNQIFVPAHMHGAISEVAPSKTVDLIVVGGAQRDSSKAVPVYPANQRYNPNPSGEIQSWFRSGSSPGVGSNIVTNAIWSPAEDIEVSSFTGIRRRAGTSHGGPIVTATVALMKSRNPNLTPRQILDILRSSPARIDITHNPPVLNNEPFLDIQDAVEKAIKVGNKPLQVAKLFPGQIEKVGDQVSLRLNRHAQPQSATNPATSRQRSLRKTVSAAVWNSLSHGQFVSVLGWASTDSQTVQAGAETLSL